MLLRVLLAPDPSDLVRRLRQVLDSPELRVSTAPDLGSIQDRLTREDFDLLFLRRDLIPDPPESFVPRARRESHRPDVVVFRDGENVEDRVRLLTAGCLAVLPTGLDEETLRKTLSTILLRRRDERERGLAVALEDARLDDLGVRSQAMRDMVHLAYRVAEADTTVFLLGETGTGKERLARAIHLESPRRDRPFVAVNCAALPETLLESELFGHEQGAFTGAAKAHRGYFEVAHGGTLFLDEVAEMTPSLQGKLLRALQERTIQRLGSERSIEVDVRILAATSRDVQREMEQGTFRQDLYYRLAVVTLTVPPLRERRDDLPELVESLLQSLGRRLGRPGRTVGPGVLDALAAYPWPGNVRELSNVLERALLLADGTEIHLDDLPASIIQRSRADTPPEPTLAADEEDDRWDRPLADVIADTERAYLKAHLRRTGGHVSETARRAGLDRRSVYEKMKRYGLTKEQFRS